MPRAAGLLIHPTALASELPVGDLGPAADRFLEWAAEAGQTVWQVLPLAVTGYGESPYGGLSTFAGNPLLLSPERLVEDGLLASSDLADTPAGPHGAVDFDGARRWKGELLGRSWRRFGEGASRGLREEARAFEAAPEQEAWLDDWSLFSAVKQALGGGAWWTWPEALRRRDPEALAVVRRELADAVAYHRFVQFLFDRQWRAVRGRAAQLGVSILGDLPFYVAPDSADVWSRPELFDLDEAGRPAAVAGVPPDYFSETGQLWGNPVYRWQAHQAEGFRWWSERIAATLRLADHVRLDHFRALAAFWRVPADHETAEQGEWVPSPGRELLTVVREKLGGLPLIAEDLGVITPDVEALRDDFELPGTRVLQFAFGGDDNDHLPHRHVRRAVVYTGTHDNDTTAGWIRGLPESERRRALTYVGARPETMARELVRCAFTSVAETAVVPLQDVLGLGSEARFNTPGRGEGNWSWRLPVGALASELAGWLRELSEVSGRLPAAIEAETEATEETEETR